MISVFGGLRPIYSRLAIDLLTVAALVYSCLVPTSHSSNAQVLLVATLVTFATAGLTKRWPLTLPMAPILILQCLRRITNECPNIGFTQLSNLSRCWSTYAILIISLLLAALSVVLTFLFPSVELPPVQGPYYVGAIDCFLPVQCTTKGPKESSDCRDDEPVVQIQSHVNVRIFYPTLQPPTRTGVPHLKPTLAVAFCEHLVKFGAPSPLKRMGWMLHYWRYARLRLTFNASLIPPSKCPFLPVVMQSHGLGATNEIYSYQALHIAAQGSVVVSITHTDGSAPVAQLCDDSLVVYNYEVRMLNELKYTRCRRQQTSYRAQEMLAAITSMATLNRGELLSSFLPDKSSPYCGDAKLLQFTGRLITDHNVICMGHSFGGVTALTAAYRRPDLISAVVAHEPIIDWLPDEVRASLFASKRSVGLSNVYNGGTGGYMDCSIATSEADDRILNLNLIFLYSEEWMIKRWGSGHIIQELFQKGRLGNSRMNCSSFDVILSSQHTEFSDTPSLTPVWLGRATGTCGKRSPAETAHEIASKTSYFLNAVQSQHPTNLKDSRLLLAGPFPGK